MCGSDGETTKDDLCWPSGRGGHDMCIDSENGMPLRDLHQLCPCLNVENRFIPAAACTGKEENLFKLHNFAIVQFAMVFDADSLS